MVVVTDIPLYDKCMSYTPPAKVAQKLNARAAFLRTTCTNLIGMADRAVERGDVQIARDMLAELVPFQVELDRFVAAGWGGK